MRRMREHDWSRRLVRETQLSTDDLVYPMFVIAGKQIRNLAIHPDVDEIRHRFRGGSIGAPDTDFAFLKIFTGGHEDIHRRTCHIRAHQN